MCDCVFVYGVLKEGGQEGGGVIRIKPAHEKFGYLLKMECVCDLFQIVPCQQ